MVGKQRVEPAAVATDSQTWEVGKSSTHPEEDLQAEEDPDHSQSA